MVDPALLDRELLDGRAMMSWSGAAFEDDPLVSSTRFDQEARSKLVAGSIVMDHGTS
jgi:hypothetical protein